MMSRLVLAALMITVAITPVVPAAAAACPPTAADMLGPFYVAGARPSAAGRATA
jgi:hypothetical protein